jgi:hypothetical protein
MVALANIDYSASVGIDSSAGRNSFSTIYISTFLKTDEDEKKPFKLGLGFRCPSNQHCSMGYSIRAGLQRGTAKRDTVRQIYS